MLNILVISRSDTLIASLKRYLHHTRGAEATVITLPAGTASVKVLSSFRHIADSIESSVNNGASFQTLRETIVLFDLHLQGLEDLNPTATKTAGQQGWAAVAAMLVLAFPEIYWVFITPCSASGTFKDIHILDSATDLEEIFRLHDHRFTPLFDPTSLRNAIRNRIRQEDPDGPTSSIPVREEVAASIDDEESYAYLHSYTAYRFGFRSHMISSYGMMEYVFGNSSTCDHVSLSFEDLYLKFPDGKPHLHLSQLETIRDQEFSKLKAADYRIFVTIGHHQGVDDETWHCNKEYLRSLQDQMRWSRILYKPVSGIFDLWKRSGLRRALGRGRNQGLAPGFVWPPQKAILGDSTTGHSAPGRLLAIADHLIRRAEGILPSASTVPDAVHGSLLSLEAREILGNRAPTTSLAALAVKHQLEVIAECLFYGVEYNKDVRDRFHDIKREVLSIGDWFRPRTRRLSELNAEISIMSELMIKFREYNQFDEEQECLARLRGLHRHLWFAKHKWWAWIFYPSRWYVELLLGSMLKFITAIGMWIIGLALGYRDICFDSSTKDRTLPTLHGFSDAVTAFFGFQPPHEIQVPQMDFSLLTMLATVSGFVHLGIFVSHLYSVIARR
jgi:hypothetical protein